MKPAQSKDASAQRALVVAHQYWPIPGSASQVLGALVRALREQGYAVTVLTNAGSATQPSMLVGRHGEKTVAVAGPESSGVSIRRILDLGTFAAGVLRHGRREQYDLVVSDAPPTAAWAAARLARRRRVPFVYYFSDSWAAASQSSASVLGRLAHKLISIVERTALRASTLCVAVTSEMSAIASAFGARNTIEVLNGIDTAELRASDTVWSPGAAQRPFFLYAGNAGVVHGAEVFVDAAELLWSDGVAFDLVFMGYGAGHRYARAAQARWGDRIVVLDNQPTEIVAAAFRGAAGALSSLRPLPSYAHARPMKSLTGAACGTPAVYVGEGDFANEIRENGLGFVSAWDPMAASEIMKLALALEQSADRQRARQTIQSYAARHYDERAGARRVVSAIDEIMHRPGEDEANE